MARQFASPGPEVQTILSIPPASKPASFSTLSTSCGSFFKCSELAKSGTTPP